MFMTQFGYVQTITLDKFLDKLKQSHPFFDKEKLTAQIEQQEQNSLMGAQDWNLIASANYSHEEPAITFAGPDRTDAIFLNGGVERLFWATGGRFSASVSLGYAHLDIIPLYNIPDDLFQNRVSVSYSHPLMKNRKGFLDQLQYELKQYDIDFSEIRAIENMEGFLTYAAVKYLDWAFLAEQKVILEERLKLSEEEYTRTERKRKANLIDQVDVIRAEDAVRIWRQNLELSESQWKALRAELAVLTQDNEINQSSPDFNLYKIPDLGSLDAVSSQLKQDSRLLNLLAIQLNQLDFIRTGYSETAKPDLNALVEINLKRTEDAFGEALLLRRPDALLSLQYKFPVKNRTAKSNIIKTDLQISKLKKEIDVVTINLTSTLTNLHVQMQELQDVMVLNLEQIESSKERTNEELKLYNQGRGDLTFVIQSRDNEQYAKLTYAVNALTYHKLLIEYQAILDHLYQ
jgi:hypothetical protein